MLVCECELEDVKLPFWFFSRQFLLHLLSHIFPEPDGGFFEVPMLLGIVQVNRHHVPPSFQGPAGHPVGRYQHADNPLVQAFVYNYSSPSVDVNYVPPLLPVRHIARALFFLRLGIINKILDDHIL